jgi:transcription initiation factor TFIIH subunit 1
MLRVAVLPSSASAPQIEETHNFTFIAASSSISDREHFKKALSTVIAENRERAELSLALPADPVGPEGASRKGKERADNSAVDSATKSFQLRKLVLTNNPALVQLHRNLVMSGDISEAEFWEGREDLLKAAEVDDEQKRGRSGEMVDPRPETSESGEVTVKITPALIREIFEEYPAVLQAYHDNVPSPVSPFPVSHQP